MTYVVIDDTGNVSYGFKTKADEKRSDATPQQFEGEGEALKRAKHLAKCSPGEAIGVYRQVKTVMCPIGDPEVH